ncbi:MAG: transcriptional repressor [Nitrospirota bacterium]|jgi:Fur family ferric uptake transcriptional regulator
MAADAKARFEQFLEEKGLRMTPQRSLIADVFLRTERHMSSEDLYALVKRKDRSIGQATVYRTLKLLSESGIAREVDFGEGVTRYEHEYGHEHHDHLICERCRRSIEVVDPRIEELQEKLARDHGFVMTRHKLDMFGICSKCMAKGKK